LDRRIVEPILKALERGRITRAEALRQLALCYEPLEFANLDVGRELRTGVSEAVLCEGKSRQQVVSIARAVYKRTGNVLLTRASAEIFRAVKRAVPAAKYNEAGRLIAAGGQAPRGKARIAVVSAGTSDVPVAEEAAATCEFLGNPVERVFDVGVAGIHRLFGHLDRLRDCKVVIVVAGMEGALASVVGGLVGIPVIGVPTSIGYGASFKGLAPLLGMLNSCAPGVTVVNIDNGFGAAVAASLITKPGTHY
jgi:NCAIR mutase (PurE)-related protein